MPHFGPASDPNFETPSGNILLAADHPDPSFGRCCFVDNRGTVVQVAITIKEDGYHVRPISAGWGIAVQGVDEEHPTYPRIIFD